MLIVISPKQILQSSTFEKLRLNEAIQITSDVLRVTCKMVYAAFSKPLWSWNAFCQMPFCKTDSRRCCFKHWHQFLPSFRASFITISTWAPGLISSLEPSLNVTVLVIQSCPTLFDPMDYSPPGSTCPWDFPDKNTGVGCHALLQGIKPRNWTQVSCIVGGFLTRWATREAPSKAHSNLCSDLYCCNCLTFRQKPKNTLLLLQILITALGRSEYSKQATAALASLRMGVT